MVFAGLWAEPGLGLSGSLGTRPLDLLPSSSRTIGFSSFERLLTTGAALDVKGSFGLHDAGQLSFADAVKRLIRSEPMSPLIEIRSSEDVANLFLADGAGGPTTRSHDVRFFVRGIPLCRFQVRAHQLASGGSLVLGRVPEVDLHEPSPSPDWPDLELAGQRVMEHLEEETGDPEASLSAPRRCFYVTNRSLLPVWEMVATAKGMPYLARADGYEMVSLEPLFFSLDGKARVFPRNINDTTQEDVTLPGLVGDGTLSSEFFKTVVPPTRPMAIETSHVYAYPPTDPRFTEVMAYAQAQKHFDFMRSLGFAWYGPKPMELILHVDIDSFGDNALFTAGSETKGSLPSIKIATGVRQLQNLVTDGDVVSHEFGHHVVYQTLKKTEGEALVLHEGLADFFVFSRTQDPCLGESICPAGSTACYQMNRCLRSAETTMSFSEETDSDWMRLKRVKNRLGHLHSQAISGLLWDLTTKHGISLGDVTKLTFKSVSLLAEESDFCDFFRTLYAADQELFAGRNQGSIGTAATNRGFATIWNMKESCPKPPTTASNAADPTAPAGSSSSGSKKKSDKGIFPGIGCGVIGAGGDPSAGTVALVLILCLPLTLSLSRRGTQAAPASRRQSSKRSVSP
jgi:hypothetical protein